MSKDKVSRRDFLRRSLAAGAGVVGGVLLGCKPASSEDTAVPPPEVVAALPQAGAEVIAPATPWRYATTAGVRMCDEVLAKIKADDFTGDRFTFLVIADVHTARKPWLGERFVKMLRGMTLLAPSFIVMSGDLIHGHKAVDPAPIHKEWDHFIEICAASRIPQVPLPGNHDIWSPLSLGVYQERIGPVNFSFSYGNAHFICLTTEDPDNLDRIGPEQLRWLKEDLEAHQQATHIFVFMHKPVWRPRSYNLGGVLEYDTNWMEEVWPVLLKYPVAAVFAGHEHIYRKEMVDGMPYFVTGGGGTSLHAPPKHGGFHHFVRVSVNGDEVHNAVVKYDAGIVTGIENEDVITGKAITTQNT